MAARPVHGLALCSGAGGLELGVRLALGPRYRAVAHVERDPFAAAVLVARMADQALDQAPVWDDLRSFDGRPWRGRVDLVTAGFPCQPWSAAGRRQGIEDDRWLWPDVARIVAEVGPRLVLLENVPGLLAGGLGPVLGDLADLGFDAEWDCFAAADLGAPHLRRRIFILAWLANSDRSRQSQLGRQSADHGYAWHHADGPGGPHVADSGGTRRPEVARGSHADEGEHVGRPSIAGDLPDRRGEDVADPSFVGEREPDDPPPALRLGGSPRTDALRGSHLWPPAPEDTCGWEDAAGAGLPQPAVRRVADGLAHRLDRLHTIGNGVVPLVAGYALRRLAQRAGVDLEGGVT